MAITAGRASAGYQTIAGTDFETIFDATLHGGNAKVARVYCAVDEINVRVTAKPTVHGAAESHQIAIGENEVFKASLGVAGGGITLIQVQRASATSEAKWTVLEGG